MRKIGSVLGLCAASLIAVVAPHIADAAQHHRKPHCVVPSGWQVVARDQYAVVDFRKTPITAQPVSVLEQWRYCLRHTTRFKPLTESTGDTDGTSTQAENVTLTGRYVAYDSLTEGRMQNFDNITLFDLLRGKSRSYFNGYQCSVKSLLLAPSGVAVWIANACNQPFQEFTTGSDSLDSLDAAGHKTTLATAPVSAGPSPLANLGLYQCVAGCTAGLVAWWTDQGVWNSANVS